VAAVIGICAGSLHGAEIVPKRTDFTKYQAMLDRSPFAIATAAALPAATPSFAKDLYIANAARSPEGDLVTLASASDKNFKEYLSTRGPNEHGYGIANIEWSDRVGQTKVTISKDGQFASVGFNQALLAVTPGTPPAAPSYPQPQIVGQQPQIPGQPQAPIQPQPAVAYPQVQPTVPTREGRPIPSAVTTPAPRVRGVIPRNPNATTVATPAVPVAPALPPNSAVDE
jgi:hypothetical protein